MSETPPPTITAELVNNLLASLTLTEQMAYLQANGLLTEAGLSSLLTFATQHIRQSPEQSRQLAELGRETAVLTIAPAIYPQATYLLAQTHTLDGDLVVALDLINEAHDAYLAQNDPTAALRTLLGLMNVLGELGDYPAALAAGQTILDTVTNNDSAISTEQQPLLVALAEHNQGVCYEQMGRFTEALTAYQTAEASYQALGMDEHVGHINNNRGVILLALGRGSEALAAFNEAAAVYAQSGSTLLEAKSLLNSGTAHLLLGSFSQSLDAFNAADQLLEPHAASSEKNILLLDNANAYLSLNLYPEAIASFREAEAALQASGSSYQQARALWGLGATLTAQGQFDEATAVLDQALQQFIDIGNVPLQVSVQLERAALLAARQERGLALQAAQEALNWLAGNEWPIQRTYAHLRLADLLLPDVTATADQLAKAEAAAENIHLPQLRYRLKQRQGHLALLQDQLDEAQPLLETAVAAIEQSRGTLLQEMLRASFLRDKTAAYEDLVQLYLKRGDEGSLQTAFAIAEQAKSRALVDLLTGLIETQMGTAVAPDLAARLQTLQADLNILYNQAFQSGEGSERRVRLADINARALTLEQEISRLQLKMKTTSSPRQDALTTPISLSQIRQYLPEDVTLLTYFILNDEIMAFIHHQGQLQAVRHVASLTAVAQSVQHLQRQLAHFRGGSPFVQRNLSLLERSAQKVLGTLYRQLIAPLAAYLSDPNAQIVPRLAVVPHGLLHQIPFHALFDGGQYLIDQYEISYGPSATILALCQNRPFRQKGKSVLFGLAAPEIPAVAAETCAVAHHLDAPAVFLNEAATLTAWYEHASECGVLHMACHGLFRGDNPMFSGLKLHDGWLTASDVMKQDLTGALVTLSACESGRSRVMVGDELIGLTRAFLGAGATTLVVSLWLVEDETTAVLMANWYENMAQRPLNRAAALRSAQLALKEAYPHPYYWAPFIFLGKS